MNRFLLLFLFCSTLLADSILIRNITVVDVASGALRPAMNVFVARDRITRISPGRAIAPKGTTIVDGTGKYLIPGLWDMHVHLWESSPMFAMYLANGVTSVRDMGSDFVRTDRWRKQPLAPRVFTSGPAIDGAPSTMPKLPIEVVTNNQQAEAVVNRLDDAGADFIKVLSRLTPEAYDAVAYRARLLRIPFAGHVPDSVPMTRVLDARQKSVEHLFGMPLACSTEEKDIRDAQTSVKNRDDARKLQQRAYETYSEEKCLELFRRSALMGVYHTPTLTMLARMYLIGVGNLLTDPNLKYVPEAIRKAWENPAAGVDKLSSEQRDRNARYFNRYVAMLRLMRAAHTGILAGTDTGDDYVLPGFALHDELQWFVTGGLTPLEALQTATKNAAEYFKLPAGAVEPGKIADLVIVSGNPLQDISNVRHVNAVILRGKLLDRTRLDQMLAAEAVK